MFSIITRSRINLCIAAIAGGLITFAALFLTTPDTPQNQTSALMENKLKALEALLAQREADLKQLRLLAAQHQDNSRNLAATNNNTGNQQPAEQTNYSPVAAAPVNSLQVLKDLGTNSVNDPRSFQQKVSDLLAADPSKENIAIVTKSVFDMTHDRDNLPDYVLQSLYDNQTDADLKRVIAQVLSQRGNNALLDNQISETQTQLQSDNPSERQNALTNLAKTHYVNAANAIAPLLQDADINVKLDALLALRATGNQTHISLAEKLLNDPDPAVSSLAGDVISNLRNLSDSARTTLAMADISAELPPMEHP